MMRKRYVTDRDDFLDSATWFEAWILAAQIEAHLTKKFGARWWEIAGRRAGALSALGGQTCADSRRRGTLDGRLRTRSRPADEPAERAAQREVAEAIDVRYNFDGIVGLTHNYGGLSPGNLASTSHGGKISNPRAAARQGLRKMRFVRDLGVGQAVLPPQPRPSVSTLRQLGFSGSDEQVLATAAATDHQLLRLCSSAAAMWTANAATVAPSADTADRRVHFTPANLQAMFHRAIEAPTTTAVLRAIFADPKHFVVHDPLPGGGQFADEGAANHTRLQTSRGVAHLFACGSDLRRLRRRSAALSRPADDGSVASARTASPAPAPDELLPAAAPAGIDAGAFHTDVLAVGNGSFLMAHEKAFLDWPSSNAVCASGSVTSSRSRWRAKRSCPPATQ